MRAIIVGHTGQDGTLLRESLEQRGYEVAGFGRSSAYTSDGRRLELVPNILDAASISAVIRAFQPLELYYLAARHGSSQDEDRASLKEAFDSAQQTHVTGLLNCLCAIRDYAPACKLFYASSSLVFSGEHGEVQDEETPLSPIGFYAITKAQGMWLCREFREKHRVFASVGILYNHESCLRPDHFLSQKVIRSAIRIAAGSKEKVIVGDLSARVDWGYAPDFVDAFQRILALEESQTFIVASGEAHSVQEFAEIAFDCFELDWREHVTEDRSILVRRPLVKIGNPAKLTAATGWKCSYRFPDLVKQLVTESRQDSQKSDR